MRFIRFNRIPEVKDVTLKPRIRAERDGIFALMVHYLQRLMTLSEIPLGSAKSQESRERFAITNDPIGAFVKARCILDRTATTSKEDLAKAYEDFLAGHGLPQALSTSFFKALYDRLPQLKQIRSGSRENRYYAVSGIKLKPI